MGSENLPALLALTFPGSGSYDGRHAMRTCLHWKRIRNYPALNPPGPFPEPQKSRVRLSVRESLLVHLLHFTGEETEAGRWRMKVMICPRCTGTGSPSQDWSPGPLVKGGSSSYSADPESPKRQQEPGGREVGRRRSSWGCAQPPRPRGPLPAPPPACAPSCHLLPRPPGGAAAPPVPMATRAPGRPPWPLCRRAAHLAPSPPQLGRLRPRPPGDPHNTPGARDQGWSASTHTTYASTWSGCWVHPDGSEATLPCRTSHSRENPPQNIHPVWQETATGLEDGFLEPATLGSNPQVV